MINQILSQTRTILCLDGNLPNISYFPRDKMIIAADGAANKLNKLGINPDLIIGDLDSIKIENFTNSKIIMNEDQNTTDFKKCLNYISDNNLAPFIVYGVDGGFLDRILANIDSVIESKATFYSEGIIGAIVSDKITLPLKYNTKISIFGFDAIISTKGLKWELENEALNFPGKNSACNRAISSHVEIELAKGEALVLIYEDEIKDKGSEN